MVLDITIEKKEVQIRKVKKLPLDEIEPGSIHRFNLHIISDGAGNPVYIPVIVAKGKNPGPTLGLTAALHGNEINGIPVIQKIFQNLNPSKLSGTLIGVLVTNMPGFLLRQRKFNDGVDLNRIIPGKKQGNKSDVYAHRLFKKIIRHFDYLIDLHTASRGRVNSYYIRADITDEKIKAMARVQFPDILLENKGPKGTLRRAAQDIGIPSMTIELRDPQRIQQDVIKEAYEGVINVLKLLGMRAGEIKEFKEKPVLCSHSYWLYSDTGGILSVKPKLKQIVEKGEIVAVVKNIFGDVVRQYNSPEKGIVIGKSVDPVCQTGDRIIHLGVLDTQKKNSKLFVSKKR